jgi:hypothetical protein
VLIGCELEEDARRADGSIAETIQPVQVDHSSESKNYPQHLRADSGQQSYA